MPGSILTPRSGELSGALRLGSRELGREVIQVLGFVSKWPPTARTSPALQGTASLWEGLATSTGWSSAPLLR